MVFLNIFFAYIFFIKNWTYLIKTKNQKKTHKPIITQIVYLNISLMFTLFYARNLMYKLC